ncbi:glycoside hydrolase [Algoriphagus sp. NG3]|uniref:glycoside hydrolase n=1 Tax=Algoriphagus sp. NG3 TaxID=3097546 RepID=UPI002A815A5D|nr:glycoside hydrolase [Algoriphagus sp. NG3]WPR76157.1 glycoside hydrolase [Algoriphagus sp. NG3]
MNISQYTMIKPLVKYLLTAVSGLLISCQSSGQDQQRNNPQGEAITVNALNKESHQTIEHFGASDAWSTQFVGLWPYAKKRAIAELLFSMEEDTDGNPKGIGLSMWRFNVGAGSAGQGEESGIRDEWRRAESFLETDGSYNWEKQAGQVWFAQAAKEFGVGKLLLFPNSPPVSMTKNGRAYASDAKSNLDEDNYEAFGEYLTEVTKGLEKKGLSVAYISPVNEPQWDWSDGGQEGTPFWNNEISGIVKALDKSLAAKNLQTKIDVAEAGKIDYLYEHADKEGRGKQVRDFFHPESSNYIGDLTHVSPTISAHSYFTTSPFETAVNKRSRVSSEISSVQGLSYWMSEYCILGDNGGEINGNGRDLGIDPALYVARVIHNDLTVSNASAWHWWLAVSPYDYKDGLVYIDKQKEDGNFYESKMLWVLGNYSRYIRPGYQRIGVEVNKEKQQTPDLLVSAYQSPSKEEMVFVLVNSGIKEVTLDLTVDGKVTSVQEAYVTSKDKDLESMKSGISEGNVTIPARSIVTVLAENGG